jgi:hypothetical protein
VYLFPQAAAYALRAVIHMLPYRQNLKKNYLAKNSASKKDLAEKIRFSF